MYMYMFVYNTHVHVHVHIHVHVLPDVVLSILIQDSHKTGLYDVITISNRHIYKYIK